MNKMQIIKGYCCVVKCDNYLAQHYVIAIKENMKDIKNFIAKYIYKNPEYTSWSDFIIQVSIMFSFCVMLSIAKHLHN